MSIRIKKKSRIYKLIEQPKLIDMILFQFLGLGLEYNNLLLLDKIIHHTLKGRIRYHVSEYQKKFNKQYSLYFNIHKKDATNICSQFIKTSNQTIMQNLAIPIYFQLKKTQMHIEKDKICEQNKFFSLSFSYEMQLKRKKSKNIQGIQNKKIDSFRKFSWTTYISVSNSNRVFWMYKENHSYGQLPSYGMDVMQMKASDTLCLKCPFYSSGCPIKNLQFYALQFPLLPPLQCPVKKLHNWCPVSQKNPLIFQIQDILNSYPQFLQTKSIKKSSLQNFYCIELLCIQNTTGPQLIHSKTNLIDILDYKFRITKKGQTNIIYLKKNGCYDEDKKIQLRVGDLIVVYILGT